MAVKSLRRGMAIRRRTAANEDGFLLVTLAQSFLCVMMIAAAFFVSAGSSANEYKQAFSALLTEDTQSMQVFAAITDQSKAKEDGADDQKQLAAGGMSSVNTNLRYSAVPILSAPLLTPVQGNVTSGYGQREHPITGNDDFHTGVDIAAAQGTPVVAAVPGVVEEVGSNSIYGNYILLHHGGFKTRYCHCSSITAEEGERVSSGEEIALVGSTGMSTGPHLHFELWIGDSTVDPMLGTTWI